MKRLQIMQAELESFQLVTVLTPSKRHDRREWDQIRTNLSVNCVWYRRLCAQNLSSRGTRRGKSDTIIRRQHTLKALDRMLAGSRTGIYEERILAIIKCSPTP